MKSCFVGGSEKPRGWQVSWSLGAQLCLQWSLTELQLVFSSWICPDVFLIKSQPLKFALFPGFLCSRLTSGHCRSTFGTSRNEAGSVYKANFSPHGSISGDASGLGQSETFPNQFLYPLLFLEQLHLLGSKVCKQPALGKKKTCLTRFVLEQKQA